MSNLKNKVSLLAVQGGIQFINGYISFLWYEKEILKSTSESVLLIYDTCTPKENEDVLKKMINNLAAIRGWNSIIFIDSEEMRIISNNQYARSINKLRDKLPALNFDNIFIMRDFGSFGTQLILNAYPNATHIEYGDSFGLVGNETETELSFSDFVNSPLMFIKFFIKKVFFNHFPVRYNFQFSILSMPIDWSGTYLADKQLVVPDKKFVEDVVFDLSNELPELKLYCSQLLNNVSEEKSLYLLSNFTNSGLSSFRNELKLYEDIIIDTAKKGSTVFIKNHPRCPNIILNLLFDRLHTDYDVRIINDENFSMYPIELWGTLIEQCKVYPVFSTSVISLKYLYSKQVVMPLSEKRVKKFIYANKIEHILQSEAMFAEVISTLENWDGTSILWSGKSNLKDNIKH